MKKIKNLVVGCGFSGSTIANKIATELKEDVLVIDSKEHIAGHSYDSFDANGICVHKYGAHIFHTDSEETWKFLSQFTKWYPYMHKVKGMVDGNLIPVPFNLNSLRIVFPQSMADTLEKKLLKNFGFNVKIPIITLRETPDKDLRFLADYIYNKIFLGYTIKQWNASPEKIDHAVTARVPIYISRDDRYFQNKYQGIPMGGYTRLIENMLSHKRIKVLLMTSYASIQKTLAADRIFYTGPIDEFFGYKFGELPYRSLRFDSLEFNQEFFQSNSVINYPENHEFTRIIEHKYFLNGKSPKTIVSFEYPQAFKIGLNERYYPFFDESSRRLYSQYAKEASRLKHVFFLGRLGAYKYYDMDKAVDSALTLFKTLK